MLDVLCGSRNVQRVLIFLFVNGRCYGTQMHRSFKIAPIQKALARLEKGGLLTSYYEDKTKLYQFNPAYPLLTELEALLKKAYTLLPSHEKKNYHVVKEDTMGNEENKLQTLLHFWEKLTSVTRLNFNAKTQELSWNGRGKGDVLITKDNSTLIFTEKGTWQNKEGTEFGFSNTFRWVLDRNACMISLEHLRRGPDRPVFLFHLASSGKHSLSSIDSHLCGGDAYFGQIHFDQHTLRLNWRVIGPKKNEELDYYYS